MAVKYLGDDRVKLTKTKDMPVGQIRVKVQRVDGTTHWKVLSLDEYERNVRLSNTPRPVRKKP